MQRRGVVDSRPAYGFNPRFARNARLQVSYDHDEMTEYDREATGRLPPQSQANTHVAGPLNYRTPNFDRHSYGIQSVSRPSYRQPGQLVVSTMQHARQHNPNTQSTGHRLLYPTRHASDDALSQDRGANPRNVHGIRLRPVSELPDIYRGMFKFGVFNAVQSKCFDTVMHTDENMVISAPTGSGKTVLFELAIIRMLLQAGGNSKSVKCVYVAPTKALCSEKCRDWTMKFAALGVNCCEMTGDTVQLGRGAWGSARDATVIVTTGEKWDSLTRNWRDHGQILNQVHLFLVDEVHILNESRGSTLEVILSRMKLRGSSTRFVVVSATVPNIEDVASWIGDGTPNGSATVMQFGEEYRPCKLTKIVYGIPHKREQNDFAFQKTLDYKLYAILQQHSVNKPLLVFCSTRKGVLNTAQHIMKEYEVAGDKKQNVPWSRPTRIEHTFQDKSLHKLAACGIGVHHAGMTPEDRRTTEDLYIKKILRIIFATSTLAVGVNLPAHTVILKGVKVFQSNTLQEYSDLDIMQMMGRAGRPQFDKEGVAIIMCESELEAKYKALVQGQTVLESSLHLNLSEHINSEVGLGTITDIETAKEWLHNSFLYRRIQKNPRHYAIGKDGNQTWQQRLDDLVAQSIVKLQEAGLVAYSDERDGQLCSTEYGDIMSKFYVKQSTMALILKLPERATARDMVYNKMRTHNDIRYQIKKIEKPADKVFILVQAVLACINLSDPEYRSGDSNAVLEAFAIFRHIARIMKVVVEVAIVKQSGSQLRYGMELMRCVNAKAWEDRHFVLRQIDTIGEKSLQVLAGHGITTIAALRQQDPMRIDVMLNRKPPFGFNVIAQVQQLPQYTLRVVEKSLVTHKAQNPVEVELEVECGMIIGCDLAKAKKNKTRMTDMTSVLTVTSETDFVDFRRIPTKALKGSKKFTLNVNFTKPSQSIVVYISSELYAGVTVSESYKPQTSATQFPMKDTRPKGSTDVLLEGLDEDPDFWNMAPDDEDSPAGLKRTPEPASKY
ncbi:P-loop containing nucleoside triphosphate hydrolase protein, partial [Daedalea quercina L-15889]